MLIIEYYFILFYFFEESQDVLVGGVDGLLCEIVVVALVLRFGRKKERRKEAVLYRGR